MDYTVSMAVDARVDVNVSTGSPEEAFALAEQRFPHVDLLNNLEIVGVKPVNCTDEHGNLVDA